MKKNLFLIVCSIMIMIMGSCRENQTTGGSSDVDALMTDSMTVGDVSVANSVKHTIEYIAQRIDSIYEYKEDNDFCSANYLELDEVASIYSRDLGYVYLDCDHWITGNDIDEQWSYTVKEIKIISDTKAIADILIHNFKDQQVILDLVFERDDWYVDDFYTFYTDNKGTYKLSEKKKIGDFIAQCAQIVIADKYDKVFSINKYIKRMNEQSWDKISLKEYALMDIDHDGKPEVCARNMEDGYVAVFSIVDDTPTLMIDSRGVEDLQFYNHCISSVGSCGPECTRYSYCPVKNSKAVYKYSCWEIYENETLKEGSYKLDDKEITKEEADKLCSSWHFGEPIEIELKWKPIQ